MTIPSWIDVPVLCLVIIGVMGALGLLWAMIQVLCKCVNALEEWVGEIDGRLELLESQNDNRSLPTEDGGEGFGPIELFEGTDK